MPEFRFVELLGVRVNVAPFEDAVESVLNAPDTGVRLAIHFANAHSMVEANRNPQVRAALNRDVVEPDGMPLVFAGEEPRRQG